MSAGIFAVGSPDRVDSDRGGNRTCGLVLPRPEPKSSLPVGGRALLASRPRRFSCLRTQPIVSGLEMAGSGVAPDGQGL
jgi:hypothetical protein